MSLKTENEKLKATRRQKKNFSKEKARDDDKEDDPMDKVPQRKRRKAR